MRIAPISFGKAVKVNGTPGKAYDITRLVNEKNVSENEKYAQKQARAIFNDTTASSPASIVTLPYVSRTFGLTENVYIVSGEEAKLADKYHEEAVDKFISTAIKTNSTSEKRRQDGIMSEYYSKLGTMLAERQEDYTITPTYNKKGTSIKSIDREYAKVYAVSGSLEQMNELESILKKSEGNVLFINASKPSNNSQEKAIKSDEEKDEKEFFIVVTGKEMTNKYAHMQQGFNSLNRISQDIERFINLDDVKEQAKSLQEAMKQ